MAESFAKFTAALVTCSVNCKFAPIFVDVVQLVGNAAAAAASALSIWNFSLTLNFYSPLSHTCALI